MRRRIRIVYQLAFSVMFTTVLCLGSVWSPGVAKATEYYVATDGDDMNLGTESRPFRTLNKGISILRSNDTLYIRGGTYAESIHPDTMSISSGTSWSNPVTISGYAGETATIQGHVALNTGSTISYVIFNNLVLEGGFFVGCDSHHIRLSNSEVKNAGDLGVQFCGNYNEVINCSVHDSTYHGLYISSSNNLFDGNKVYNNGWYGYHLYVQDGSSVNNNIIRNSEVYGNGSGRSSSSGIVVSSGSNNEVYNNIVRDNTGGIQVSYGSNKAYIHNNTVYNNTWGGIDIFMSIDTIIERNILHGNGWGIADWGSINTVISDNTE